MKSKPNVIVLLAALTLVLTATIQAQTTNPPYLTQFPSVARVKAEIKGTDLVDTAARQQEAFWLLHEMILQLAGQRFDNDQMTRAEDELSSKYFEAFQWYQYKERAPSPQDGPRWNKLLAFYEKDPGFLDDLLKRFFSPQFRAGYYRATGKQPPMASAQPTTRPTAPPTQSPVNTSRPKPSQNQPTAQPSTTDAPADESWTRFYTAFQKAVKLRNKAALKNTIKFGWASPDGDFTPEEAINSLTPKKWRALEKSLALGTKPEEGRPRRQTKDCHQTFILGTDGKWYWWGGCFEGSLCGCL